jgi:hypothetical protein
MVPVGEKSLGLETMTLGIGGGGGNCVIAVSTGDFLVFSVQKLPGAPTLVLSPKSLGAALLR